MPINKTISVAAILAATQNSGADYRYTNEVGVDDLAISMLPYCSNGAVTYYDGYDPLIVDGLHDVLLVCRPELEGCNPSIDYLLVDDPKATFYYISHLFGNNHDFELDSAAGRRFDGCFIGVGCEIGEGVVLHPNVVVRSGSRIGDGCVVESGSVIGSTGLLWTWDSVNSRKVMLSLTGATSIGAGSYLAANNTVVRGACNEETFLGPNVMLAPNNAVGHGASIGAETHFANGILIGGGARVESSCFLGSGSVIQPGLTLAAGSVLGANATLTKSVTEPGVYAGTPAKRIGNVSSDLKGVPATHIASHAKPKG